MHQQANSEQYPLLNLLPQPLFVRLQHKSHCSPGDAPPEPLPVHLISHPTVEPSVADDTIPAIHKEIIMNIANLVKFILNPSKYTSEYEK